MKLQMYKIRKILNFKRILLQFAHPPKLFFCDICDSTRILVRTDESPIIGSRCLSCLSTAHHRAIYKTIREIHGTKLTKLYKSNIYEISAHGALFNVLKKLEKKVGFTLSFSEHLDDWKPGQFYDGVRCEDVECLTYDSETFDLVTSTDLMEHVENDLKGFGEIFRVLRPGGYYIFTVPFSTELKKTTIRAMRSSEGVINYFLEPEYHGDPFRGDRGIFTWRNYGMDLLDTLKKIGFEASVKKVYLKKLQEPMPIILAKKLL